ncbi:MAG TPA: hypothetical protein VLJ15_07680 [Gammaproteobacteria bacterium]|nr:hypothetical protein [Gammaproteobacteria bacterium]
MKHRERPLFKRRDDGLFAIKSSMPQLITIAIVVALYYYISAKGYFPQWKTYLYYGAKAIIALEILIAGGKSLVVPLLAMGLGAIALYLLQIYDIAWFTTDHAWQLIVIGVIAFFLTFIVRLLKR